MEVIKLSEIDWNNLNKEDFLKLNEQITSMKVQIPRKKRIENNEKKVVKLYGKMYSLPTNLAERLIGLKSEASKKKLIDYILLNYIPLEVQSL